jgi:hypothetical protein
MQGVKRATTLSATITLPNGTSEASHSVETVLRPLVVSQLFRKSKIKQLDSTTKIKAKIIGF